MILIGFDYTFPGPQKVSSLFLTRLEMTEGHHLVLHQTHQSLHLDRNPKTAQDTSSHVLYLPKTPKRYLIAAKLSKLCLSNLGGIAQLDILRLDHESHRSLYHFFKKIWNPQAHRISGNFQVSQRPQMDRQGKPRLRLSHTVRQSVQSAGRQTIPVCQGQSCIAGKSSVPGRPGQLVILAISQSGKKKYLQGEVNYKLR